MSTADEVYARIDDLVPPSDLEILDGFCTAIAERNNLAARLAEVEAENAELIEKLKAGLSRDDRTSLSSLFGYDLGVEEGRAEGQAERDRLAQELEDERAIKNQALGHLRDVTGSAGYVDRANAMGEALSFLARFPVKEGDGNG